MLDSIDGIYVVDIYENSYRLCDGKGENGGKIKEIFGEQGSFSNMVDILTRHIYRNIKRPADYYEAYLKKIDKFKGMLGELNRVDGGDDFLWVQLNLCPYVNEGQYIITLSLLKNFEQVEIITAKERAQNIQGGYLFSMYVDADEARCHSISIPELDNGNASDNTMPYDEWRKNVMWMVEEDKRDEFIKISALEYLTTELRYRDSVSFECKMRNVEGEFLWVRIIFCRADDDESNHDFIYLVQNINHNSPMLVENAFKYEKLSMKDSLTGLYNRRKIEEIFARGIIQAEAMNFIRGRSFVNTYLIIDEAQNMTPNQVKGIITRAGKGTKIVLLGDPNQIDRPFLDERTNGLSYASEYMKGSPLCYQITMSTEECERSELAMDAIRRL